MAEQSHSVSPSGEMFPLPSEGDRLAEMAHLEKLVRAARDDGKEIVVVMGVGFVGAVMAAIIADTVDKKTGKPSKFVIGCQRPSARSYWKIPLLNRGESPVKAEDPEVDPMIARCVNREEDAHRHLQQRLPGAGRLRGGRRAVRLHQARPGQHADRRGGDERPGSDHADHRREGPAALPDADRDHRGPGHDGVRGLADHEEGLRRPGHRERAAAGPQLRAGHARPRIRLVDPRFLARLLGLQRRGPPPRREVPPRSAQHREVPADGHGPADRVGDHEDRRELLPGDDPGVPERVEPLRRAQRRRPDQGHQGHQDAAHAQQHDLPRSRASAATACPRTPAWATGPTSTSSASRTATRSSRSARRPSTSTTPAPCTWPS